MVNDDFNLPRGPSSLGAPKATPSIMTFLGQLNLWKFFVFLGTLEKKSHQHFGEPIRPCSLYSTLMNISVRPESDCIKRHLRPSIQKCSKRPQNYLQKASFLTLCIGDCRGLCGQCRIPSMASPSLGKTIYK
jgi:hypothetical protein